jgi:hypothetical protein
MNAIFPAAAALVMTSASQVERTRLSEDEVIALAAELDEDITCRDRIHAVRDANGLAALDRDTAHPDEGYLIAAVDRRIEGCSVMVMRHDTRDIRPLPKSDGKILRIPAY